MENIVRIQSIISALIGLGSAVIVAILAGIVQLRIAKRNEEIQERQLEQSREEFIARMEQSQKDRAITRRTEKS
jgi:voltage-gated potassium channel Kch